MEELPDAIQYKQANAADVQNLRIYSSSEEIYLDHIKQSSLALNDHFPELLKGAAHEWRPFVTWWRSPRSRSRHIFRLNAMKVQGGA